MVESVGSEDASVRSVGKAVMNGVSNYLSATQTDKSHGSCGSGYFLIRVLNAKRPLTLPLFLF